jgi:putative ABC transport system permease protein
MGMLQDLRFGFRGLLRNPTFTAIAILTLALGLGANAAIFSIVNAVLLKPLPYPDPGRLVMVWEKNSAGFRNGNGAAALTFLDWRDSSKSVAMAASSGAWLTMTGRGEPRRVQAQAVSPDYFEVLGAAPATGRTFRPEEGVPGNDRVLLVSHRFWQEQLGLDPEVLGKTLTLDGMPYTVIGTLAANSWFDRHPADVWVPAALTRANTNRAFRYLLVYGRLRPGATTAGAQAELSAIAARLAHDYPETNAKSGVIIDLLEDRVVSQSLRRSLYLLFAAVGAVLLVACVNLANLLLARSASRDREVWVRLSLGAGRVRLLRQFLTESVLLSVLGGAAGCGLAKLLLTGLVAWIPPRALPTQADVRLDWQVLAYLFMLAIASGILFGLAPAIAAWRRDVSEGLKEGQRGSTGGASGARIRSALIVVEVALTFVLAATAGVLIRSFERLTNVDTGVNMTNVVALRLPRAMQKDIDGVREAALMNEIQSSVARLPGVIDAAITSAPPMQGFSFGMPFSIQGASRANADSRAGCGFKIVGPRYFSTLGLKIKAGRGLQETDLANSQPVAVINESMAKEFFKNANPIGQHLLIPKIVTGKTELGAPISWEIAGVVADERVGRLDGDSPSVAYVTFDQSPIVGVGLVVRAHGDPMPLRKSIEAAIWSVNKDQAITDYQSLEQIKSQSAAPARFNTLLLAGFAGIALLLAAVGIYGVVSYSVAQRTRELGIRAALGASRGQLLGSALRNSLGLTVAGLMIGAIGIHWTGRLVASMLYNTQPAEPQTLVVVAAALASVALAASLIPARRAARIDPMIALRQD